MNSRDYHNIITRYKNEIINKETDTFNEKALLSALKSSIEWECYSDAEKHKSHRVVLSVARKTDNFKEFEFQILLIEIYELMITVSRAIGNQKEDNTIFRLASLIEICKYYKGEFRDLSQVNIFPFKVLSEFIHKNEKSEMLRVFESDFKEISGKIDLLLELKKTR